MAKGQPNGLATLDSDGVVPKGQLPAAGPIADVPELTAEEIESGTVTKDRYNAVVADLAAMRATVNELLAGLRDAEYVAFMSH